MDDRNITLISFGFFEREFLEQVADAIMREYHYPVQIRDGHMDIGEYFDPARNQYEGNKLLVAVDSLIYEDTVKAIGLFSVDLYIPILTFIFGQAFLNGRTGIVSIFRLKNERYGMPADEHLLLERTKKEVLHELGHTFGLPHCHIPRCVMRSGTYVEDIDQKDLHLCHNCRSTLQMSTG